MAIPERTQASIKALREFVDYVKKIADTEKMIMLEIGAYTGLSTILFAQNFLQVITIDPFKSGVGGITNQVDMQEVYNKFLSRTKDFKNITHIKDYSFNALKQIENESIDICYIDGDHEYNSVKQDIYLMLPKIKKSGVVCGHDFTKKFPGVQKAVKEQLGFPEFVFGDTTWLIQKSKIRGAK